MKKKTKFSLGMKIVTFLTVITMASVGFASWVITKPVDEAKADGSIYVEEAETKENPISFDAKIVDAIGTVAPTKNVINYGTKTFTGTNYKWLTNDTIGEEYLSVYVLLKITNEGNTTLNNNITVTLTANEEKQTSFENAMEDYITKPTITPIELADVSEDVTGISATATYDKTNHNAVLIIPAEKISGKSTYQVLLAINFGWGKKFSADEASTGVNAYEFYNKQKYDSGLASKAEANLNALYAALTGVSYKVTIGVEEQA